MEQVLNSFVDDAMSKSSLITTLINDHGILHIIASIAEDRNDGITTTTIVPKPKAIINLTPDQGFLTLQNPIQLIIKPIIIVQNTSAHCLLGHLTLIHVTRGLVVVEEGDVLGQD
jgi:hypothetical protein